MQKSVTAGEK